jgi:hypothetical protein
VCKQGSVGKIYCRVAGSGGDFAGRCDPHNLRIFNHNGLIGAQLARAHVEHVAGANHCSLWRSHLRVGVINHPNKDRERGGTHDRPTINSSRCLCVQMQILQSSHPNTSI